MLQAYRSLYAKAFKMDFFWIIKKSSLTSAEMNYPWAMSEDIQQ